MPGSEAIASADESGPQAGAATEGTVSGSVPASCVTSPGASAAGGEVSRSTQHAARPPSQHGLVCFGLENGESASQQGAADGGSMPAISKQMMQSPCRSERMSE